MGQTYWQTKYNAMVHEVSRVKGQRDTVQKAFKEALQLANEFEAERDELKEVIQRIYDTYGIADIDWMLEECPWLEAKETGGAVMAFDEWDKEYEALAKAKGLDYGHFTFLDRVAAHRAGLTPEAVVGNLERALSATEGEEAQTGGGDSSAGFCSCSNEDFRTDGSCCSNRAKAGDEKEHNNG